MNKKILFFLTSVCMFTFSCSNEIDEAINLLSEKSDEIETYSEAYISPRMADIIAYLDTCKSPVPIEEIYPIIEYSPEEILLNESSSLVESRAISLESYTGRTSQQILSMDKQVTINEMQVINWQSVLGGTTLKAGTYYLTITAVTYEFIDSRSITKSSYTGTNIGIDPDNENTLGYHLEQPVSGLNVLTSYVYALKTQPGDNYLYTFVPWTIYNLTSPMNLTWYYYATT